MNYIKLSDSKEIIERQLIDIQKIKIKDFDKFIEISQKLARKSILSLMESTDSFNKDFVKSLTNIIGVSEFDINGFTDYSSIKFITVKFIKECILKNKYPESVLVENELKLTPLKLKKIYKYRLIESLNLGRYHSYITWHKTELKDIKDLYRDNKSGTEIRNISDSNEYIDFSKINTVEIKEALLKDVSKMIIEKDLSLDMGWGDKTYANGVSLLSILFMHESRLELPEIQEILNSEIKNVLTDILEKYLLSGGTFENLDFNRTEFSQLINKFMKLYPTLCERNSNFKNYDIHFRTRTRTKRTEAEELFKEANLDDFIDCEFEVIYAEDVKKSFSFKDLRNILNVYQNKGV